MKHVIIGTGAAGITAAKTIRSIDPGAQITMISSDGAIYSRSMLHYYISDEKGEGKLAFVGKDFFDDNNIEWIKGTKATGIDTENRIVAYNTGTVNYDRLLIATGAESVIPPVGAFREAANVFSLRHLSDARNIKEIAKAANSAVIVGAGLVGLDAAYSLLRIGKKVTVVEIADRVLALNLDRHASLAYQKKFEEAGCVFYLGNRAADTVCAGSNVTSVILDSGERLDCDMVVVAVGVRPAVEVLSGGSIVYDKAIAVDGYMRTNVDGVFAAGDVTGLSGIWPNAAKQGEVAAKNMCGQEVEYTDQFALKNTINFYGLTALSIGKLEPGEGDREIIIEDRKSYKKVILTGNTVSGVVLQGDISNSGYWQHMIKNNIELKEGYPVFKTSFADYFGLDADSNYVWN